MVEVNVALALDDEDMEIWRMGFRLNDATIRFLKRIQTQKVIASGVLDKDVTDELIEWSDRMFRARAIRMGRDPDNYD